MVDQYIAPFQIVGSSIKNIKIRNDFVEIPNHEKCKYHLDVSHQVKEIHLSTDQTLYVGMVVMNIKVSIALGKKKYALDLSIEGCFDAPVDSMDEAQFVQMVKVNGLTSLYSIARGFVQSVTSQTVMSGTILLPMINIVAYSKDLAESESKE